ncbi:MAG: hypothetical protein QM598_05770 [Protaetiibacter sp.]
MKFYPLILGIAFAIITIAAFVIDQGGHIEAQQRAQTIAQGAARAGTNAASGNAVNGDAFDLAAPTAAAAAESYIAAAGPDYTGSATVDGQVITVTVHTTYKTRLAYWVGISELDAVGIGSARLIDGDTP